jgi:hypothetical protein
MTRNLALFVGERDADANSTKIAGKADSHHIALQKGLLSGLLTFLFGDAARLDAVNLGLIHFDQNVGHLLDFGHVIIWAEQCYGVAAAVAQGWRVRLENHGRLGSAVPRPVNLIARNAHDVAGPAAVAPSVDEEKDLAGHDIIHLLAVVPVRACVIARGAFSEHETGIGSMNLLRS